MVICFLESHFWDLGFDVSFYWSSFELEKGDTPCIM